MTTTTVPVDYEVQPITPDPTNRDHATCGHCGLTWDDSIVTGITPAPSARCPFEPFHTYGWEHDPQRDGAGCSWCGAWAQVNADNLCRDCFDEEEDA